MFLLGLPPFTTLSVAKDAAAGWRCWDGALKVMAGNVTPIRVPNVVLLSWKKEPVDCITTAQREQKQEVETLEQEQEKQRKSRDGKLKKFKKQVNLKKKARNGSIEETKNKSKNGNN